MRTVRVVREEEKRKVRKPLGRLRTGQLQRSPAVHLPPLNPVVCRGPYQLCGWGRGHLGDSFALRCFQRFSGPDVATRRCSWQNSLRTSGPSAPVLSY